MINIIKKIRHIFPKKIVTGIIFLYFCLIILTIFEFVGIGSIPIMITMMLDPNSDISFLGINVSSFISNYSFTNNYIISLGLIIVFIFLIKALFLIFFNIFELSLRKKMKLIISKKLISAYLKRPFIYFINHNSSKLSKMLLPKQIKV